MGRPPYAAVDETCKNHRAGDEGHEPSVAGQQLHKLIIACIRISKFIIGLIFSNFLTPKIEAFISWLEIDFIFNLNIK